VTVFGVVLFGRDTTIQDKVHCMKAIRHHTGQIGWSGQRIIWWFMQREEDPITVFMGVPTMYSYLLTHYASMAPHKQAAARKAAARLRLTVSGSAACPLPVMHRWHELSGQHLLDALSSAHLSKTTLLPLGTFVAWHDAIRCTAADESNKDFRELTFFSSGAKGALLQRGI
jgi:acyl-CoA synthetase (AMP-forming)/AMP-acid ligase II